MKKFDQKFRMKTRMDESEDNVKRKIITDFKKSMELFEALNHLPYICYLLCRTIVFAVHLFCFISVACLIASKKEKQD